MLNSYFQKFKDSDPWNETTVVTRAESLFDRARALWPHPAT